MKLNKDFLFAPDDPPAGGEPQKTEPEPKKDPEPQTVPYERFKEINDKNKDLEARLAEVERKKKEEDDKALKEKEDWKTLAEKREQELADEKAQNMRLKVASKKGIPVDLIDRLRGATEDEIEADADKLLEFMKPDESLGVPPRKKGGQPNVLDINNMSPEEIRKNKGELYKQAKP